MSCEILVPQLGIKPESPVMEAQSLNHWTAREARRLKCFKFLFCLCDILLDFSDGSDGEESSCNARDPGLIPGLGRSPGEGNGYPLQDSCLENSRTEPGRLQTMGSQESGLTEQRCHCISQFVCSNCWVLTTCWHSYYMLRTEVKINIVLLSQSLNLVKKT